MRKYSYLATLLFICGILFSQSTYSGNLSVSDDVYFKNLTKSGDYYLGGCNAFPIGTFVNVKLPYSDDSVNVKIVKRIPEDGIFILIDKKAGEKLFLETDDVLPVRIQVLNFTPPPITPDIELDPEPEIKGLTALNVTSDKSNIKKPLEIEEPLTDSEINPEIIVDEPETVMEDTESVSKVITPETFPDFMETVDTEDEPEVILDDVESEVVPEIVNVIPKDYEATVINTEDEISSEPITEVIEEVVISEPISEVLEEAAISEPIIEASEEEVPISEPITEILDEEIIPEPITEILEIYEDELPVDSMFGETIIEESMVENTIDNEEMINRVVNRIFFLEPANKKPPEGGIPDSELIQVTMVDKEKPFKDGYYLQVGIYTNSDLIYKDTQVLDKLNFPYIKVKEIEPQRERILVGPLQNDELGVIMLHLKSKGFIDFFRYKKKSDN